MKVIFEPVVDTPKTLTWFEIRLKPGIYKSDKYYFIVNGYGNVWFLNSENELVGPPTNWERAQFIHVGGKLTITDEIL